MHRPSPARRPGLATVLAATLAVATSLTAGLVGATAAGTPAAAASLPACPLSALAKASGPVNITFWNSMVQANGQTLQALTNTFNASQSKVHVTLVNQANYDDTWQKYLAGLSTGQYPDVVQLEDLRTQQVIDSRSILPAQSCINAAHYATSDYLSRALAYWRVNGVQQGMPFAVSNPVVYYNKQSFTKAGLNPDDPPTTLAQYVADAKALKAAGIGTGLKLDPWHLATWLSTANTLFVNHQNGRAGRTTKSVFNNPVGLSIFAALSELVNSGAATTNPATGPDVFDNLLGIGSGKYGMTIDTTADLGTITSVLSTGKYPNVTLGVWPFPVVSARIRGGIEPGGSGVWISNKVPAVEQAAAWQFIAYLDSPAAQATWAIGTGYIPIRKSAAQSAQVQQFWAANPGYEVAYNQLLKGATTPATAGAVIGAYADVNTDIINAEISMFTNGVSPRKALANAASSADATIAAYNQRLGVG
jgi:sn-glycerol 3-phosphate transport system substrate-binding protein